MHVSRQPQPRDGMGRVPVHPERLPRQPPPPKTLGSTILRRLGGGVPSVLAPKGQVNGADGVRADLQPRPSQGDVLVHI